MPVLLIQTLAGLFALAAQSGAAKQPSPGTDPASAEDRIELEFTLGAVGYQGNVTRQRFDAPGGAQVRVRRHGGELLGGLVNVATRRRTAAFSTTYSDIARGGFLFGGTPTPTRNGAAVDSDKPEPRAGFNFGIFASNSFDWAAVVGGQRCGFAVGAGTHVSLKAYTRSTVPGNHLRGDAGLAAGLHCAWERTFLLAQWAGSGLIGVEQMQDLRYQQGNDAYSPSQGNGFLLYPAHGPRVTLVHKGERWQTALSARGLASIGRPRFGGRRLGARAALAVIGMSNANGFGVLPWYEFERIEYGSRTKVSDTNTRLGHTFGVSLVYSRAKEAANEN